MLNAVEDSIGLSPQQVLADAGYRSEENVEALVGSTIKLVVVSGREGKRCAEVDAQKMPRTAAMAEKLLNR